MSEKPIVFVNATGTAPKIEIVSPNGAALITFTGADGTVYQVGVRASDLLEWVHFINNG